MTLSLLGVVFYKLNPKIICVNSYICKLLPIKSIYMNIYDGMVDEKEVGEIITYLFLDHLMIFCLFNFIQNIYIVLHCSSCTYTHSSFAFLSFSI